MLRLLDIDPYKNQTISEDRQILSKQDQYLYKENYTHQFINKFSENNKSVIIICSKDHKEILSFTLSKLYDFDIHKKYDILLVDDRSVSKDIYDLSMLYNISYLRIDNDQNKFNYSMINNIASLYCYIHSKEYLIFYNNDMWPANYNSLDNILNYHIENNSDITGCKLLYPTEQDYVSIGKPNHILSNILDKIYTRIQHGGIYFSKFLYSGDNGPVYRPAHQWRFYNKDHMFASLNSRCFAVTGALQIFNTNSFLRLNGFYTNLSTSFQDIDICLRALCNNMCVNYVGSEYLYHAESLTHFNSNITHTPEFLSDNMMWAHLWHNKLSQLIGYTNG